MNSGSTEARVEEPILEPDTMPPPEPRVQASRNPVKIALALVKAIRPHQATKNLFLYAALLFVGKLFDPRMFLQVTEGFLLFTGVAGSIYLLNDLLDVEADRRHPKKCKRPIASGQLPVPIAWIAFVLLAVGCIGAGFVLQPRFGAVAVCYFVLQIAYCVYLKHQVLLDVFTIAAGFVLRVIAGAMVINVHISHWLMLCSLQLALFLGFGKRRQELVLMKENAGKSRAILQEYSLPFLDQMINIVCAVTIVCYSVYSVESDTAQKYPHLWATVPLVIFGVCRYLYLVYQKGWGGAPDEVLKEDRTLQVVIGLWFVMVLALFALDKPGQPLFGLW